MPATSTRQTQSGADVSTTSRQPTEVVSTRTQPAQVSTTVSGGSSSTTVHKGTTSSLRKLEQVGATISFTIKVNNGLPPLKSL